MVRNGLDLLGVVGARRACDAARRARLTWPRRGGAGGGRRCQWIALVRRRAVILGLTFTLGMLVGPAVGRPRRPPRRSPSAPRRKKPVPPAQARRHRGRDRWPIARPQWTRAADVLQDADRAARRAADAAPKPEAKPVAIKIRARAARERTRAAPPTPPSRQPSRAAGRRPPPPPARREARGRRRAEPVRGHWRSRSASAPSRRPRPYTSRSAPTRTAARPTTRDSSSPAPGSTPTWSHWRAGGEARYRVRIGTFKHARTRPSARPSGCAPSAR